MSGLVGDHDVVVEVKIAPLNLLAKQFSRAIERDGAGGEQVIGNLTSSSIETLSLKMCKKKANEGIGGGGGGVVGRVMKN